MYTTLFALIALLATPAIHAMGELKPPTDTIEWEGSLGSYEATVTEGRSYTYNASDIYEPGTGSAPMSRSSGSIVWYHDSNQDLFSLTPGGWVWANFSNGQGYTYDASTKIWQNNGIGADSQWTYSYPNKLERTALGMAWSYNNLTRSWKQTVTDSSSATGTFSWKHDFIQHYWTQTTTGDVWYHAENNIWLQIVTGSGQSWQFNPSTQVWTNNTTDAPANSWAQTGAGTWHDTTADAYWQWNAPTESNPRGTWQLDLAAYPADPPASAPLWTYNESSRIWEESGSSNTAHFPPLLPNKPVQQYQELAHAYNGFYGPKKDSDTVTWTDGREEIEFDAAAGTWTWTDTDHYTSGATRDGLAWQDNIPFSPGGGTPAYSERWTLSEGSNVTVFANDSATLTEAAVVHYYSTTNQWVREDAPDHIWQYNPESNEWHHLGIDATWQYNTYTREWVNTAAPSQRWQYLYEGGAWVWKNLDTDEKWQLIDDQGAKLWSNLSTFANWSANGIHLDNDSLETWQYSKANNLWYKDGDTGTTGAQLFPFFPPTPAAQVGRMQQVFQPLRSRFVVEASEAEALVLPDPVPHLSTIQTEHDAREVDFNNALDQRGTNRADAMSALATPVEKLNTSITTHIDQSHACISPLHQVAHEFTPSTTDGSFAYWNKHLWRFPLKGKGVILFEARGNDTLTIGLSKDKETLSPDYTITIMDSEGNNSVADSGGTISSAELADDIDMSDSAMSSLWLSYDNGVISFGSGSVPGSNQVYSVDLTDSGLTLADSSNLSLIEYFSFTHLDGSPFAFRNIRAAHSDLTTFGSNANEWELRIPDEQSIGYLQEPMDTFTKPELLAIANKIRVRDRMALSQLAQDAIQNPIATAKGFQDAYDADPSSLGGFNHAKSWVNFTYIYTELSQALESTEQYLAGKEFFSRVEGDLTSLLNLVATAENQASFDAAFPDILASFENAFEGDLLVSLNAALTAATLLEAVPGNNPTMTPYLNYLKEEIAITQIQALTSDLVSKWSALSFEQKLVSRDESKTEKEKLAALAQTQATFDQEEASLINTLATQMADGTITPFAAVVGPLTVLVRTPMDQTRSELAKKLDGLAEIHDFATEGSIYSDVETNKTFINDKLKELEIDLASAITELILTLNPGTDREPEPTAAQLDVDGDLSETLGSGETTDITEQTMTLSPGDSAEEPTNVLVQDQGIVEEVIMDTTDKVSAPARVYQKDAEVTLGTSHISASSNKAVSVLAGTQFVADGDGRIRLADKAHFPINPATPHKTAPIVPAKEFGVSTADTRCVGTFPVASKGKHKIEFFSSGEETLLILHRDTELDLTAFGTGDVEGGQKIVFGSNVTLEIHPGARIRLPYLDLDDIGKAPTIEFAGENSRLVFVDPHDRDSARWTDVKTGSETIRNTILGSGKFVFSGKNSRLEIRRNAIVGIQSDYITPRTDVTFEFTGQNARLELGTDSSAGGALQIGNIQEGGYDRFDTDNYPNAATHPLTDPEALEEGDELFEPRITQIDFGITLSGTGSKVHVGREGFIGFGAGIVNKSGNPNGDTADKTAAPDSDSAWRLQSLHNVANIKLKLNAGCFRHHNVAQGDDSDASMIVVGPQIDRAVYHLSFSRKLTDIIKGGGNMYYLPSGITDESPHVVNIWDTASTTLDGTAADAGKYSLLAPRPTMEERAVKDLLNPGSLKYGLGRITRNASTFTFTGNQEDFYRFITMHGFEQDGRYVVTQQNGTELTGAYVKDGIISSTAINLTDVDQSYVRSTKTVISPNSFSKS